MVTVDKVSFYSYLRLIIDNIKVLWKKKDVYCFLMQMKNM